MALACLSKPTAMAFPALALAVEAMTAGAPRGRRLWKYLPPLLLAAATGLVALHSQHNPEGVAQAVPDTAFSWRALNGMVALGLYLAQTFVPAGLHPVCRPTPGEMPPGALPGLAALAVFAAAVAAAVKTAMRNAQCPMHNGGRDEARPFREQNAECGMRGAVALAVAASALWFLAAVVPTLGILAPFGMQSRADRFTYLPAMGISIALAHWLSRILGGRRAKAARVAAGLAVVLFALCGARQTEFFRDDMAFFGRAVRCDPANAFAWTKLGEKHLHRPDEQGKGVECFRRAYAAQPTDEFAGLLAYVLAERGDPRDFAEIKTLCAGLAAQPELDEKGHATQALGAVAFAEGRFADAVRFFEAAERVFPPSADLELRLAASHFNAGNLAEAERRFRHVLRAADGAARDFALQSLQKIFTLRRWKSAGGGSQPTLQQQPPEKEGTP